MLYVLKELLLIVKEWNKVKKHTRLVKSDS